MKISKYYLISGGWVALALLFDVGIWIMKGPNAALDFLTAYSLEKMLSVDNLFVISLIFQSFSVPHIYQSRVLTWGIGTAVALRLGLILGGLELLAHMESLTYILGVLLLYASIHFFFKKKSSSAFQKNWLLLFLERSLPFTSTVQDGRFFIKNENKWQGTSLLLALISIEISDVIFALDSVPAVLSITRDPFIALTSNIFALLGLRALYHVLAESLNRFHYLSYGVALILGFVGLKMILAPVLIISNGLSLLVIALILGISVILSLKRNQVLL